MIRATLVSLALLLAIPAVAQDHTDVHHDYAKHADDHGHEDDHDAHVAEADGLRAVHAWANATTGSMALVYLDIENLSETEIVLTGGETGIAASVALVGLQNANGELTYTPIPQMPVAAGSEIVLSPNGLALQLSGLTQPLVEDETFTLELEFGETHLPVMVLIEPENATQHSHAGHNH